MSEDKELIAAMMQRIEQLEAKNATTPSVERKYANEAWLVYDPSRIRVWCSKVECPHLNREVEKERVKQTVTVDETLADALGGEHEVGEETEVEIEIHRVTTPRAEYHPLGVVATFPTEREAAKWVDNYYKENQYNPLVKDQQFCITQVSL